MTTLVCFHAHPDDESTATAGIMAKAAAHGMRTVLVVATNGEHGEPVPGVLREGEQLWERRIREAHRSGEVLGVARVELLGYRDSGMMGEPTNDDPACFWRADVDVAAERLAEILRAEDDVVLTVYDDHGGYGHPDHIQVHRVGVAAAERAGVTRVFESTMNRDAMIRSLAERPPEAAEFFSEEDAASLRRELDAGLFGSPETVITHGVDVTAYLDVKRRAMAVHESQIAPDSFFLAMPDEPFALTWGTEWFIERGAPRPPGAPLGTDIFAVPSPGGRVTTLHLVRHAEASAGWGDDIDPGLSERGHQQAAAMAAAFPAEAVPIISSPLRRARETASALERRWGTAALIDPGVGELPSPSDDLAERQAWLRTALASTWPELGARYTSWRTMVLDLLLGLRDESVIVTHYVLINAVIGAATGSDAVICHPIANAAVVQVNHDRKQFEIIELPGAAAPGFGSVL